MLFAATGIIIVMCISLFGWGALVNRFTRYPSQNFAVIMTVGLGVIVFFGGVLNLLHIAYGWAFDILIIGGIVLTVCLSLNTFRPIVPQDKNEWLYVIVLGLVIALIMGFTMETQLPPQAFNFHDDLEKYFSYPVHMLQTGTLFGSPLNSIGYETLGGQAVLHGLILNHFPIPYINGADAIFGLFLCLILSVSMVPRRLTFLPIALISLLMVFSINPQYVNVSALYLGSAFMMAAILLFSQKDENANEGKLKSSAARSGESSVPKKQGHSSSRSRTPQKATGNAIATEFNLPPPMSAGLIYAALLALKSSFLFFPALHIILFCITLAVFGVGIRRLIRWGLSAGIMTLLFLSPWLLLHLPNYIHWSPAPIQNTDVAYYDEHLNLFSLDPLFYGASFANYTFLAMAMVLPLIVFFLWRRKADPPESASLAGVVASATTIIISYLLIVSLGVRISDYAGSLRYTVPFLIAGAPVIMTLSCLAVQRENAIKFTIPSITALLLLELLIIVSFSQSLINRVQQASQSGNILAFSKFATTQRYLEYNDEVLHGNVRSEIAEAQKHIPAGQAFVAWVSAPFYFDYRRNVIFDVNPGGLETPWAYMPQAKYFIIQYKGFAVRPIARYYEELHYRGRQYNAERCLAFMQSIIELNQNSDELFNDGKIVVFRTK